MEITLKKLISKREASAIIGDISGAIDPSLVIEDADGKVLKGNMETVHTHCYQVEVSGEVIGWVRGNKEASTIASLLHYMAEREMEKKMLVKETLEKYREITLLYDTAERITSCLDLKEVARLVLEEAMKFIDGTWLSVKLFNDDSKRLEIIAASGKEYHHKTILSPAKGIEEYVFAAGKGEIVNDVESDPRYIYIEDSARISSLICSPLKIKDRAIGTINISSENLVNYAAEHLKLLNTLASQAASAIENARLYEELRETFFAVVYALAETIEKRDPYTGGHTKRVTDYSLAIGEEIGLKEDEMTSLRLAATLHDIGKIGVKDSVLLKEGKLTDEEFEAIKMHSLYGEQILRYVHQMKDVIPGVKHHHEKYNGRGYPDNLKGEEINITARIIGVADTFDAMTTDRPYRKGLSLEAAFEELRKCSGTQFDPHIVNAFFKVYEKGKLILK